MKELLELRKQVYEQIEELRKQGLVGSSLECHVTGPFQDWNIDDVLDVLIVSQVEIAPELKVIPAIGTKCDRCFKIVPNQENCSRCIRE